MAVGEHKGPGRRRRRKRPAVKGGPTRLVPPEAPLSAPASGNGAGLLREDGAGRPVPSDLIEPEEGRPFELPGRVMSLILLLAVIFIASIAWLVSGMPGK
jgi:hypothetical protein